MRAASKQKEHDDNLIKSQIVNNYYKLGENEEKDIVFSDNDQSEDFFAHIDK